MSGAPTQPWRAWLRIGRVALSVALLGWLLFRFEWTGVLDALLNASPLIVCIGVLVYYFGVWISCIKWRLTLAIEDIRLPLRTLLRWYVIGAFVSNFLPSEVGGDLGRGYLAARQTGRLGAVTRSILAERLTGLAAMLVLAGIGAWVFLPEGRRLIFGGAVAALGCGAALIGAMYSPQLSRWRERLAQRLPERVCNGLAAGLAIGRAYLRRPGVLIRIAVISFGFQLLAGFGLWLNLSAVGLALPILPVILVMALASVVSLLPIALNGWGVREGVLVSFLAMIGAPAELVLAGALLARFLVMAVTLPGGLLLVIEGKRAHSSAPRSGLVHTPGAPAAKQRIDEP